MGFSWSLSGRFALPEARRGDYLAAEITTERFDDWRDPIDGGDGEPMSVEELLGRVSAEESSELVWDDAGLRIAAIISNDSDLWLCNRRQLMCALRQIGAFGGHGEATVCGYFDGGPELAMTLEVNTKGATRLSRLVGKRAEARSARVHRDVERLVDTTESVSGHIDLPPKLLALHGQVLIELENAEAKKLRRIAGRIADVFKGPDGAYDYRPLNELFATKKALLAGLTDGWPSMGPLDAERVPGIALTLLAGVDAASARRFGVAVAKAGAKGHLAECARAATADAGSDDGVAKTLRELRKSLPKEPHYLQRHELPASPTIARLRKRPTKALKRAARQGLVKLLGGETPSSWTDLKPRDVVYAYALSLLLEPRATREDAELLVALWSEHTEFLLANPDRAARMRKKLT